MGTCISSTDNSYKLADMKPEEPIVFDNQAKQINLKKNYIDSQIVGGQFSSEQIKLEIIKRKYNNFFKFDDLFESSLPIDLDKENESLQINGFLEQGIIYSSENDNEIKEQFDFDLLQTNQIKCFKEKKDYELEKRVYCLIQYKIQNIQNYILQLEKYDDQKQQLWFQNGLYNLLDYCKLIQLNGAKINSEFIKYILKFLINFVLELRSNGLVHSNINPQNIYVQQKNKKLLLKISGLNNISDSIKFQKSSDFYFNNPLRQKNDQTSIQFQNDDERYKNEIYQVIRSVQYIIIMTSKNEILSQYLLINNPSLDQLIDIQKRIEEYYDFELKFDEEFQQIFNFIKEKLLTENYQFEELEEFFNKINSQYGALNQFKDLQNDSAKIIQNKRKELQDKQNLHDQLFSIQNYIELKVENQINSQEKFDIIESTLQFIFNQQTQQKVLVIIGQPGSGKSVFLLKLLQELKKQIKSIISQNQQKENFLFHVIRIKLSDYKDNKDNLKDDVQKYYQSIDSMRENQGILFLIDGYDEFCNNNENHKLKEIFQLNQRSNRVKIIITSRNNLIQNNLLYKEFQLNNVENNQSEALIKYICPFEKDNITKYIQNYIKYSNQQIYESNDYFENQAQYQQIFKQYNLLQEIIIIPGNLSILLQLLPKLKSCRNFTQYQIYKEFLNVLLLNDLRRLQKQDQLILFKEYNTDVNDQAELLTQLYKSYTILFFALLQEKKELISSNQIEAFKQKNGAALLFNRFSNQILNDQDKNIQLQFKFIKCYFQSHGLLQDFQSRKIEFLSQVLLIDEHDTLKIIGEEIQRNFSEDEKEFLLQKFVLEYKNIKRKENNFSIDNDQQLTKERIISSNALSILNESNLNLMNINFDCCEIPYCLLQESVLCGSKFNYANLYGACLEQSNLSYCQFNKTNLNNVQLNIQPYLVGHFGKINSICFNNQNGQLISGSSDKTIRLWNQKTGENLILAQLESEITSISYNSTYTMIVCASKDKTILIFDVEQRKQISVLNGHTSDVNSVQFNNDNSLIVSGSNDCSVIIWDVKQEKILFKLENHQSKVNSVCFNNDSSMVVSGSDDKTGIFKNQFNFTVCIWDVSQGKLINSLQGHSDLVYQVQFSNQNNLILSCSKDTTVLIWDALSGNQIRLIACGWPVISAQFSMDSNIVVISCQEKILTYDIQQGQQLNTFIGHHSDVTSVIVTQDNKYIISGSDDFTIRFWAYNGLKPQKFRNGHNKQINQAQFSLNQKYIVSCSQDQLVRLYDVETKQQIKEFAGHKQSVNSVNFSTDGTMIVSGSDDKTVRIWDIESQNILKIFDGHQQKVNSVQFNNDNKLVLSCSDDKMLCLWDVQTGNQFKFEGHQAPITFAQISSDNLSIVCCSSDRIISLWDRNTQQLRYQLEGHTAAVNQVKFNSKNTLIVSCSDDKTTRIWDLKRGKNIKIFEGHQQQVRSASFNIDSRLVVSGSDDLTVRIWDVIGGKELRILQCHVKPVTSVEFSLDNTLILSGSKDKNLILWINKNFDSQKENYNLYAIIGQQSQFLCKNTVIDNAYSNNERLVKAWKQIQ